MQKLFQNLTASTTYANVKWNLPTQRHRYRKDFFVFSLKLIIKTVCLLVLTIYTAIMQLCTL